MFLFKLPKVLLKTNVRLYSKTFEEVKIPVPWGHVAGKWWGPQNNRPVLCLHGWQDNCGTFNNIIPLLNPNIGFLAIDLPGHGYSSQLPPGFYYHRMVHIILVHYLKNFFNWNKISLMGHSMGGFISYTYSMIFLNYVDFTICLDGANPVVIANNIPSMARKIDSFIKNDSLNRSSGEPPTYSYEEILDKISKPIGGSIDVKCRSHIADRNIKESKEHPGKFYFSRDIRLKTEELLNWDKEELINGTKNMINPLLVIRATQSTSSEGQKGEDEVMIAYSEAKRIFHKVMKAIKEINTDFYLETVHGTHHVHLNNSEALSPIINQFLKKYFKEDGNSGYNTLHTKKSNAK